MTRMSKGIKEILKYIYIEREILETVIENPFHKNKKVENMLQRK